MEYKTVKDYNTHKDLVMITTYENGRTIQKTIPLCDVVFTYNGKQFKGEQIIKNLENIKLLDKKITIVAETLDKYIAQQKEAKKTEGAVF